jgi:S-adenosylmethionine-diacylglycerol 3-amino-3-carboxypropyl transferase
MPFSHDGPERLSLPGASAGRLFFAQVREDPGLEIAAFQPNPADTLVVVASGGCTALSLLAAGAGHVLAVDRNLAQNNLVELKALALIVLPYHAGLAFLGARPASRLSRAASYRGLRGHLTLAARQYWDENPGAIERGVIRSGVSERFLGLIMRAVTAFVHTRARQRRLLDCGTPAAQREFYEREWNTWRWRALFRVLVNRWMFSRTYDATFFRHVDNPSFAAHFLRLAEHSLTEVPVATNYFLHQMLTGYYPTSESSDDLPPYLSRGGVASLRRQASRLTIVDGSYVDLLKRMPNESVTGFALSNICEWMPPQEVEELFGEIYRTAAPGAVLVFRNFVGWTEVPARWRESVVEDRARGEGLIAKDRSMVQCRMAVCRIEKRHGLAMRAVHRPFRIREALDGDNGELIDLSLACPMQGDIGLCVDRSPDFFALNRLEGDRWKLAVADREGEVIGCIAVAERNVYVNGRPRRVAYVGDLKVHPAHRNHSVADALIRYAIEECERIGGPSVPLYCSVLAGNRAAERRAPGVRDMPRFDRFATIDATAVSLLWRKAAPRMPDLTVKTATKADLEQMVALWARVASARQLAPVHDAASLQRWIEQSPGLGWSSYRLAFDRAGRLLGCAGFWDQSSFKHMLVTRYSRRLAVVRSVYNVLAPLVGGARLPPAGGVMRYLTAVNVCVPPDRADVLQAILVAAYNEFRAQEYAFFTIGLDITDPLRVALKGFVRQPTLVNAYITNPAGRYREPALDDRRPLHFEIALV